LAAAAFIQYQTFEPHIQRSLDIHTRIAKMSDSQATPPSADASGIAKSFEERLTFPEKKTNWADDVEESESATKAQAEATSETKTDAPADPDSLEMAQKDGANTFLNGSGLDEPAFDVNVKLADMQADPNDPLYSIQSFKDLNLSEQLLKALAVNNFHKPSKIQERALPLLMKNPPQNFIGQSQSGTGKTAAFTLNMLSRIDMNNQQPQCLVLAPTRELARQIASNCQMLGVFLEEQGLKIGEAIPNQANRGQQITGQIIVGTPGTVFDMIKRRQLDTRNMKVLTLDEADNMLGEPGLHRTN
jgi:ATP-dependent RNA helicase DDX19/DBP5